MNNLKKIISVILAMIIGGSASVLVSAENDATGIIAEYITEAETTEVTETETTEVTEEETSVAAENIETTTELTETTTETATESNDDGIVFVVPEDDYPSQEIETESEDTPDAVAESTTAPSEEKTIETESEIDDNPFTQFEVNSFDDYKNMLIKLKRPTLTTDQFFNIIKWINIPFKLATGKGIIPEEHFNVTIDAFIKSLSEQVLGESGLDAARILTNFPDINGLAELAVKAFNIDTVAFRNEMYAKRDELWETGDDTTATLYHFLGAYFSVIEHMQISAVPTKNPDIYEIIVTYTYKDGATEDLRPKFYINTVTGECTGKTNTGIAGIGYNFSIYDMVVYATADSWMRDYGFCLFYDLVAGTLPVFFNYNTRRFKFEYDGLEWMIQIWKGNYFIANGAEVGVYYRKPGKYLTYYDSVEDKDRLPMSMQVYAGDKFLFERKEELHWWINGFQISGVHYLPSSLTLFSTITMRDEEMLRAFCESIENNFINDVSYIVDGLKVTIKW